MTVCKYFLQGICKFGDRCWNEHIGGQSNTHYEYNSPATTDYDDYYRRYHYHNPRYSPTLQQSSFSFSSQRNNNDSNYHQERVNFSFNKALTEIPTKNEFAVLGEHTEKSSIKNKENDETDLIKEDMIRWELGKQWPFSCYAPVKVCIPGFEDVSPEELRWQYYDAKESGTLYMHLKNVSEYAEQMKVRRNELKVASPQVLETLMSSHIDTKQQNLIFGNIRGTDNSFKITDNKPAIGIEQTSLPKFDSLKDFKFSLSNVPEQPKSLFRLPQFKTQDNQANMFGGGGSSAGMETSIFGSTSKESDKDFSRNTRAAEFTSSSPFFQQKDSDVINIRNVTGLSINDSGKSLNGSELQSVPQINSTEYIYTDLKTLNRSEKEQYTSNAKCFILKKIPTKPPPKEICF